MGVFSGPKISGTNNLVLSIDFANTKSYSGSGTTITSQTGSNSAELSIRDSFYKNYDIEVSDYIVPNSQPPSLPTFSSSNLGNIVFDGIGNYLNFTTLPITESAITVEMWANLGSNYSNNTLFGFGNYTVWTSSGRFGFNTSNNDLYGISSANVSTLGLVNNWRHYVFEMRSDVSYTNNRIYINGQNQSLSQQEGSELSSNRNFNSGVGRISSWYSTPGYEMPMSLSIFRVYNRSLTASEVLENFSSNRGRFSI